MPRIAALLLSLALLTASARAQVSSEVEHLAGQLIEASALLHAFTMYDDDSVDMLHSVAVGIDAEKAGAFVSALTLALQRDAVMRDARESILPQMSLPHARSAVHFLESPAGRRISAMERGFGNLDESAVAFLESLDYDDDEVLYRIELVQEILEMTGLAENYLEMIGTMLAIMIRSTVVLEGNEEQLTDDLISEFVDQQIGDPEALVEGLLAALIFTYRDASDEELEVYLDFLESDAGQWYANTMDVATARAGSLMADRIGTYLAAALGEGGGGAGASAE